MCMYLTAASKYRGTPQRDCRLGSRSLAQSKNHNKAGHMECLVSSAHKSYIYDILQSIKCA